MLILSGYLLFEDKESRDRVARLSAPVQEVTRSWPGCLEYCFSPDPSSDHRLMVFEAWEDEAALQRHFTHDDYQQMREILNSGGRVPDQTEGVPQVHRVSASSPVYGPDRQPLARYFDEEEA